MTDKKIIIDGVNVAGCEFLGLSNLGNRLCNSNQFDLSVTSYCDSSKMCLYKQLQRKEQECEELKKTVMYRCPVCDNEFLSPVGAELYELNNSYKQALEKIEEYIKGEHWSLMNYIRDAILDIINEVKSETIRSKNSNVENQ